MPQIIAERMAAETPGSVTVFAIGMRINKFWKPWRWVPVMLEMPRMLKEQAADSSIGLLSTRLAFGGLRNLSVLQLWRSAEELQAYAHSNNRLHMAAWQRFNARVGTSGDVGIWHETYVVPAGNMESVFVNMPRYGLGEAGAVFPAKGEYASAAKRLARGIGGTEGRSTPSAEPGAPIAKSPAQSRD